VTEQQQQNLGNKMASSGNYRTFALIEKMLLPVRTVLVVQFGTLSCVTEFILCLLKWLAKP